MRWGALTALSIAARLALASLLIAAPGCGRTGLINDPVETRELPVPVPEICNGLDDDLDGLRGVLGSMDGSISDAGPDAGRDAGADRDLFIDEDFRDDLGRYVHDDHCGGCSMPCLISGEATAVECALVEESPTCVATACSPGFAPSTTGRCIPIYDRLCLPCADDGDCGDFASARCAAVGTERRCTIGCALGCPEGYRCDTFVDGCVPEGGSCSCDPGETFTLACALFDPEGERCPGSATCDDGTLTACLAPDEVCDEVDNDCNGMIDDGFRDRRGAYSLDVHNCGMCGVDCTESTIPEGDLVCGGDPFAPSCVLSCPDALDGIMVGDRIDADLIIANGCECTVSSLDDLPGPILAEGEMLDVNCDGADGIVVRSFYVAPDGDDSGPGSPTRPLETIGRAFERAAESLASGSPRPHVFIASGTYSESVTLPDGVLVHGGYRRDFLALDPDGFRVTIRAPSDAMSPGGAALEVRGAGTSETVIEWLEVRGVDADAPSEATFGIYALDPGPRLSLRDLTVRAGVPGDGAPGTNGVAGRDFESLPLGGDPPRGAIEDGTHRCTPGATNTVIGGTGGSNTCDGVDVSGGSGGSSDCPRFADFEESGATGSASGPVSGGPGGAGGQDSIGPIMGISCSAAVCCGLADFTVPSDFQGPQPGSPGSRGSNGAAGRGCGDAFGGFDGDVWRGRMATDGTNGQAGSGGGGGGAGGGAEMDWFDGLCEFADGIGGGGGGGGSGGCGGTLGEGASSGAPSVAILVRYSASPGGGFPSIAQNIIAPSDGGRGGDGGAGGAGGRGAPGAFGGSLPTEERTTPTSAGPFPGARGGPGGEGGDGGGGGGGCGGASVGIWLLGASGAPSEWRTGNTFTLGRAGIAGRGGGGAAPGSDGAEGGAVDVYDP